MNDMRKTCISVSQPCSCSRRFFLGGLAACASSRLLGAAEARPLFRIGMMTDTHVLVGNGRLENVRRAYALFRSIGVEVVLNCGDIADTYSPEAYRAYRAIADETYPDRASAPAEYFVWANHDRRPFSVPGKPQNDYAASFEAAKPVLGIRHGMHHHFELGGYVFLIFPQCRDEALYERAILKALQRHPGRPVFVFDHVPPFGTTFGSNRSGEARSVAFLRQHPEVVVFCGHTHNTLYNPDCLWQDGFTCVNLGCLANWGGGFIGRTPEQKPNRTVAVTEFWSTKMVVRRFSVATGKEIEPETPWTVEWGRPLRRPAPLVPAFPQGSALSVRMKGGLSVSWPAAQPRMATRGYRLDLFRWEGAQRRSVARRETCGDFWTAQDGRAAQNSFSDEVPAAFLSEDGCYEIELRPLGFGDAVGSPLVKKGDLKAAERGPALVEGTDRLTVVSGSVRAPDNRVLSADADGWYPLAREPWILVPAPYDRVEAPAKRRMTIDLEFEQSEDAPYLIEPRLTYPGGWVCGGCSSPGGKSSLRYVFEFTHKPSPHRLSVNFNRGKGGGRFRILGFRLEGR